MPITRAQAKLLGLQVVRLLTFDLELGHPRRPKPKEPQPNIIYSLDELEISVKVVKPTDKRKPDDVFVCEKTGIPLRPVYYDEQKGQILRAVPISWREGVPYYDYRTATTQAGD